MALPNRGITSTIVGDEIGSESRKWSVLCTHPNINKWSKWKPVKQPHTYVDGLLDWWKAFDGKCGLNIPVYTSAGAITTAGSFLYDLKNNVYNWEYIKPIGDTTSPYRIGDFRNYEHSAIMPISSMPSYDTFVDINNSIQIDLEVIVEYPNTYNLTLQDITHQGTDMTNYYLGVMLYKPSDNTFVIGTSPSKISSGNLSIVLNDMGNKAGDWKAAFFMCSEAIVQGGNLPLANYIPIDISHVEVKVAASGGNVLIETNGVWDITDTAVEYEYIFFHSGGGSKTIKGIKCVLISADFLQNPSDGDVIMTQSKPDITLEGTAVIEVSGNSFPHIRDIDKVYWVGTSAIGIPMTYNQVEEENLEDL